MAQLQVILDADGEILGTFYDPNNKAKADEPQAAQDDGTPRFGVTESAQQRVVTVEVGDDVLRLKDEPNRLHNLLATNYLPKRRCC